MILIFKNKRSSCVCACLCLSVLVCLCLCVVWWCAYVFWMFSGVVCEMGSVVCVSPRPLDTLSTSSPPPRRTPWTHPVSPRICVRVCMRACVGACVYAVCDGVCVCVCLLAPSPHLSSLHTLFKQCPVHSQFHTLFSHPCFHPPPLFSEVLVIHGTKKCEGPSDKKNRASGLLMLAPLLAHLEPSLAPCAPTVDDALKQVRHCHISASRKLRHQLQRGDVSPRTVIVVDVSKMEFALDGGWSCSRNEVLMRRNLSAIRSAID